ncbi:MAG: COG4223 family protein [Hyphomicrobium sp.]
MTDKKSSDAPIGDQSGAKRPHATLDLKATEIKVAPIPQSSAATSASAKDAAAKAPGPAPAASYAESATASARADAKPSSAKASGQAAATAAPPAVAIANKRGGVFSHVAAGAIGGALALAGWQFAAPHLGAFDPTARLWGATAALTERLNALEKKTPDLAAVAGATDQRLADVEKSLAAIPELKEAQSRLVAETKAALAAAASDAGEPEQLTRLTALEDRFKALVDAGANDPNAGRLAQLAALTGKVADLETSLATQLTELRKSVAQDVDGRLEAATEASEAAKSGAQRIDRDVAGVKGDAIRIEERLLALKTEVDHAAAAVKLAQEDAAAMKADLGAVKATAAKTADIAAALAPVNERVAALDAALSSVSKSEADRQANSERIVLSLELQNLKRALDSGRPYESELAAVEKSAGGKLDLAAIDKFKLTGIPPVAELSKQFRPVANAAIDADATPVEGSVVDKLIAGAKSVVRIRKIDHAPDDKSAEAIIGRMETALAEARLNDVLSEAKALPPRAQDAVKPFLVKVEARVAVADALAALEAQLKSSLGGAPAPAETQ